MTAVHDIFRKALESHLSHGSQKAIANKSGLTLSKVNKIVTSELKGSEDDRRVIAAALGYPGRRYEDFLDLGRRALGLPVARKDPPPAPEVAEYLDKARKLLEGPKANVVKEFISALSPDD